MDKMGIIALIVGLILLALGGYAIWAFLPEVIAAVKGLVGIVLVLFGLMIVND
jgi:thiol:disulfide interchange protein